MAASRRLVCTLGVTQLPTIPSPSATVGGYEVVIGKGFDRCQLPGPSWAVMDSWWRNSTYYYYGMYIGGVSTSCATTTSGWTAHQAQTGWGFINIWVGPQAPCTGYAHKISYNTDTALSQGVAEADAALNKAYSLGFPIADTIVYYDLEAYSTSYTAGCGAAVNSFIDGWDAEFAYRSAYSGVYGSTGASYIDHFATIPHKPNAVWLAEWNGNPSVYGVNYVSSSHWTVHQRIHQYNHAVSRTYGGYEMVVDEDCADGRVNSNYSYQGGC